MLLPVYGALFLGTALMTSHAALAAPPTPHLSDDVLAARLGADVRVLREPLSGAVRSLSGMALATEGATPAERALSFALATRDLLALGDGDLIVEQTQSLPGAGSVVRLSQSVHGLPVDGRSLAVRIGSDGLVRGVTSDLVPFEVSPPARPITPEEAQDAVKRRFDVGLVGRPRQVVLVTAPHLARVAWKVPVALIPLMAHFEVWVDAEGGAILRSAPAGRDMPLTRLPIKAEVPR